MPKGFPTCSYRKLRKIIEKYADGPLRSKGSHEIFRSRITGKNFTFPRRDKDFKTATVRNILVKQLGLTQEQALKEVR